MGSCRQKSLIPATMGRRRTRSNPHEEFVKDDVEKHMDARYEKAGISMGLESSSSESSARGGGESVMELETGVSSVSSTTSDSSGSVHGGSDSVRHVVFVVCA